MKKLKVGFLSGAFGHQTEESARIYFGASETHLQALGYTVDLLTYKGEGLVACANSVEDRVAQCDVVIAYSTGSLVAGIILKRRPELAKRIYWIGVSPLPHTGLSLRGFLWAVSNCLWPFTRAFLPPWRGVRLGARHVQNMFNTRLQEGTARIRAMRLHPEPLRVCLELSFPRLLRVEDHIANVPWHVVVIPNDDGFVRPSELEQIGPTSLYNYPGQHGWLNSYQAAQVLAQVLSRIVGHLTAN